MTRKWTGKVPAPAIAVVLIVLCAVAVEYWLIPSPETDRPAPLAEPEIAPEPVPVAPRHEFPDATTWPAYHGGTDLTGYRDCRLPDQPSLLWQYHTQGSIHQTPVSDDRGIYFVTLDGLVTALDFQGNERWSKRLPGKTTPNGQKTLERFEAPVACFRSTLFAGSNAGLICALDSETGEERWTYDVGGPILGTVNLHDSEDAGESARLYVIQQDDGALHCIGFDSGRQMWRTEAIDRCDGSAAAGNGMLVYGSCAAALHVFAAKDGRLIRNIELGADCQVASGLALTGDDVYTGSRSGSFFHANVRTGQIVWTNNDSKQEVFTTPAVGREVVVFGSEDGGVIALDRESGRLKWRFETHGTPTSPVLAADKVIVGSDGVLHFLKLDSGEELWKYEVSDGIASPAIIHEMVVVASEDGTVMAFGARQS